MISNWPAFLVIFGVALCMSTFMFYCIFGKALYGEGWITHIIGNFFFNILPALVVSLITYGMGHNV